MTNLGLKDGEKKDTLSKRTLKTKKNMCKKWSWLYQWTNIVMCNERIKATRCHKHKKTTKIWRFAETEAVMLFKYNQIIFSSFLAFVIWGLLVSLMPSFYPTEAENKGKIFKLCFRINFGSIFNWYLIVSNYPKWRPK